MKTVGIIGGMGPEATVDLFEKIIKNTPAKKDQEHLHIIIDNYPQVPDRTAFILGKGESPLPYLLESVKRLERAGVDCICMACNTAHYFTDEIRKNTSLPFYSIVETVLEEIEENKEFCKKIGLMATDGTVKGRIYHKPFEKKGFKIEDFTEEIQKEIMKSIYSLKAGETDKANDIFQNVFRKIIDLGYDCLIAGCTEIPVLLGNLKDTMEAKIFDATELLARRIVNSCQG